MGGVLDSDLAGAPLALTPAFDRAEMGAEVATKPIIPLWWFPAAARQRKSAMVVIC